MSHFTKKIYPPDNLDRQKEMATRAKAWCKREKDYETTSIPNMSVTVILL